jgi:4-amino-4-deoxy-L-arabinose transferase-like glycosyltransferase
LSVQEPSSLHEDSSQGSSSPQAAPFERATDILTSHSTLQPIQRAPLGWAGQVLVLFSLVSGAATHAWHLFAYPLYITDEGIYMEQSWSVLREGALEPYTYFYDHAPAGWILISGWVSLLPPQFEAFGNAINTGRVLMLILHILSTYLLFQVTYRFSRSLSAATIACFFFNFSPLAVYYQRQVLLDNMMVFWLLLSLYLLTHGDARVLTVMFSGLAFGIGVLTKENAIFFVPVLAYLLYTQVRQQPNYRFALGFWSYMSCAVISLYFLYAGLKNELLPSHLNFNLQTAPADHVSLLYTIWWQLHRGNGSILNQGSDFWKYGLGIWFPRDKAILILGSLATVLTLCIGWASRPRNRGYLVASLLSISYAIYLIRGSQMLEFYIVPQLPFLAMNLGILGAILLQPLARLRPLALSRSMQGIAILTLWAGLLSPTAGYFFVKDQYGKTVPHDLYKLPVTYMQADQLAFIRQHIPPTAKIIIDDDLWVQLHDVAPYYKWAHSHWKAAADPAVRDKLFGKNWQNIDFIVMSNQMLQAMQLNNGDGNEGYILEALHHSVRIWDMKRGGIELQIYQVQK